MERNEQQSWSRYLPAAAVIVVIVLAGSAIVWGVTNMLAAPAVTNKQVVQQVNLVRPPPPPPPPEVDEPPPPPEIEDEVDIPEPEEMPEPAAADLPPPGELLGLDADASAGADGFGLLARRGGRDLLAAGGDPFAWYAGMLKQDILNFLTDDEEFRRRRYDVSLSLWLGEDGAVRQVELLESTGDQSFDRNLEAALSRMSHIGEAPPADLPQPVRIRIVSRL